MRMSLRKREGRIGFTIAELLVAMMIIAIIASALLVAVAGARESARKARTQAIVANISELIMQRWDSYSSRPAPATRPSPFPAPLKRLDSIRELMRMEMPERKSDVEDPGQVVLAPPALWLQYRRRGGAGWTDEHQHAECLYMILASMQDDSGSALDSFGSSEIGDVDSDGVPEILDAFGNPITWLRWAPAWRSQLQYGPNTQASAADPKFTQDSIDLGKADPRWRDSDMTNHPYALYPLVVSAGPDGDYGVTDLDSPQAAIRYRGTSPRPNDPYGFSQLGTRNSGWEDNINNHSSLNE